MWLIWLKPAVTAGPLSAECQSPTEKKPYRGSACACVSEQIEGCCRPGDSKGLPEEAYLTLTLADCSNFQVSNPGHINLVRRMNCFEHF